MDVDQQDPLQAPQQAGHEDEGDAGAAAGGGEGGTVSKNAAKKAARLERLAKEKAEKAAAKTAAASGGGAHVDPVTQYFRHYTGGIGREMIEGEDAIRATKDVAAAGAAAGMSVEEYQELVKEQRKRAQRYARGLPEDKGDDGAGVGGGARVDQKFSTRTYFKRSKHAARLERLAREKAEKAEKAAARGRDPDNPEVYVCPECNKMYTAEVAATQLLDMRTGMFVCTCGADLEEQEATKVEGWILKHW